MSRVDHVGDEVDEQEERRVRERLRRHDLRARDVDAREAEAGQHPDAIRLSSSRLRAESVLTLRAPTGSGTRRRTGARSRSGTRARAAGTAAGAAAREPAPCSRSYAAAISSALTTIVSTAGTRSASVSVSSSSGSCCRRRGRGDDRGVLDRRVARLADLERDDRDVVLAAALVRRLDQRLDEPVEVAALLARRGGGSRVVDHRRETVGAEQEEVADARLDGEQCRRRRPGRCRARA